MAENIPAGTPPPAHVRKQIIDMNTGVSYPVPHVQQPRMIANAPTEEEDIPEFAVGDKLLLSGKVIEVQSPQGGQTSVKVQLDNDGGSTWFRAAHLKGAKVSSEDPELTPDAEEPSEEIAPSVPELAFSNPIIPTPADAPTAEEKPKE